MSTYLIKRYATMFSFEMACIFMLVMVIPRSAYSTIHTITYQKNGFNPAQLTVHVGDTIEWKYTGRRYTLRSDSLPFVAVAFKQNISKKNPSFLYMLRAKGTYQFNASKKFKGVIEAKLITVPSPGNLPIPPMPAPPVNEGDTAIKVYPQPFRNNLTMDFGGNKIFKGKVKVEVFDALGNLKFENHFEEGVPDQLNLNLSSLTSGVYLVTISDGGSNHRTFRVIKSQ